MLETKSIRKNIDLYSSGLLKRGLSDSKEKLNKMRFYICGDNAYEKDVFEEFKQHLHNK